MIKIIGFIIGHTINVIGLIITLPFAIVFGIFRGISRARSAGRNESNGADIRALCSELGVPSDAYNRIILGKMDKAKEIALDIGEPGEPHHNTPWNNRLALAISAIYDEETDDSPEVEDLLKALTNYIDEYKEKHGSRPSGILLDHNVHMLFAHAGVFRHTKDIFGDIDIIPVANVENGLTWVAVEDQSQNEKLDVLDDEIPF